MIDKIAEYCIAAIGALLVAVTVCMWAMGTALIVGV